MFYQVNHCTPLPTIFCRSTMFSQFSNGWRHGSVWFRAATLWQAFHQDTRTAHSTRIVAGPNATPLHARYVTRNMCIPHHMGLCRLVLQPDASAGTDRRLLLYAGAQLLLLLRPLLFRLFLSFCFLILSSLCFYSKAPFVLFFFIDAFLF